MAASKLEIRISQLVYKIAMQFQRLYLCFQGPAIQWEWWQCRTTKRGETGSGKSKMAACKLEIRISQLVYKVAMQLKRLYLCFVDLAIQ